KKIAQFKEAGKFAEAIAPAREARAIRIRAQGPEHWQTADAKRQLETLWLIAARSRDLQNEFSKLAKLEADADRLKEKGRYADAEPLVREALEIRRKALGEEHPETATSYNNLGFNLNAQSKYADAAPLVRKALEIHRRVLGEEHPDTATSYSNVANN